MANDDTELFTLESAGFEQDGRIPRRYTKDGENISPELSWSHSPQGTKEFALICEDPDAPTEKPFVHWIVYKIPAQENGLPEAVPSRQKLTTPAGVLQGTNSFSSLGYGGPAPPKGHGTHHYHFRLFALDEELVLPAGLSKGELETAMVNHVLAEVDLVGTYSR